MDGRKGSWNRYGKKEGGVEKGGKGEKMKKKKEVRREREAVGWERGRSRMEEGEIWKGKRKR